MLTRRLCLAGMAGVLASVASVARAAVTPVLVYADKLMPGWTIGGWAKRTEEFAFSDGSKPIELTMQGWSNMTFQTTTPVDTSAFTVLTIVMNGGEKGRQEFTVELKKGDKVVSDKATATPTKKAWTRVDVPLKKMKIKEPIDTIIVSNTAGDAMEPFYINYVLFQ